MTARGIRNNNPGNLRHGPQWQGLAIHQPDNAFSTFVSMEYGIRALLLNLRGYFLVHELSTVREIINRWAPPSENDTRAYVAQVARALGVGPDDRLEPTPQTLEALARAIARHENGPDAALITEDQWAGGLSMILSSPETDNTRKQGLSVSTVDKVSPKVSPNSGGTTPSIFESDVKMAPFAAAALSSIVSAIPELTKIYSPDPESSAGKNARAASVILETVKTATGALNEQQAAEMVVSNPEARQKAATAVRERWYELSEMGDGGIKGAREFNERVSKGRAQHMPALWISFALLLPLYAVVAAVLLQPDSWGETIRVQVVTAVLAVIGLVGAFWLGSSLGSQRKDELLRNPSK